MAARGGKWVAAFRREGESALGVEVLGSVEAILDRFPSPALIAVDIPIGLTDGGRRRADEGAGALLKSPRASSVFPAPIRPVLDCATRGEASRLHERIDGRGIGAQAWAIVGRIRDWDQALRSRPARVREVFEVHPELSFRALNRNHAVNPGKKTPAGGMRRRQLLEEAFASRAVAGVLASPGRRRRNRMARVCQWPSGT
jgi:predicted RNase H-like nuclease